MIHVCLLDLNWKDAPETDGPRRMAPRRMAQMFGADGCPRDVKP